jgi:ribonuclease T1
MQHWVRLIAGLILLGMAAYAVWQQRQAAEAPARNKGEENTAQLSGKTVDPPAANRPAESEAMSKTDAASSSAAETPSKESGQPEQPDRSESTPIVVRDQTILDQGGEVAYRGDVDLTATLARIKDGKLLRINNDGSTFQNRERRLPKKPAGYYKEYVHPTPGLSGPGPQRIVMGEMGEAYYTPDHYRSFQRVDE